jgi:hypothetical protein
MSGRQTLAFIFEGKEHKIDVSERTSLQQKGQIIDHYLVYNEVLEPQGPLYWLGVGKLAPSKMIPNPTKTVAVAEPPAVAELLFQLMAPKRSVLAQLGDMQELFELNVVRVGKRRARMLYWAQVLRAIGPGVWRRIKRLGLVAFLIDYGRSKLGF